MKQRLTFRGHDESIYSQNQDNFIELLHILDNHNEDIDKVLKNARGNLKPVAPNIKRIL